MDQISVTVTGASRVDLVGKLRAFADNLDGTPAGADGKVTKSTKTTKVQELETDGDDDFGKSEKKTKETKAAKAAAASFEDDAEETETETQSEGDADDFMEAPKETKKGAKKYSVNDVNDACKKKAAATDRKQVLTILKKKFGVASVTELKAEQYADVIKAMAV